MSILTSRCKLGLAINVKEASVLQLDHVLDLRANDVYAKCERRVILLSCT